MTVLASAAVQQSGGWSHLIVGLVIPGALFLAFMSGFKRWRSVKAGDQSPTPPADAAVTADPQVSDGVTPPDPAGDPVDHGWGAVDYSSSSGRQAVAPRADQATTAKPKATRGDVAAWLRGRVGKSGSRQLIRDAQQELGASESTAKRALRDVKESTTTGGGSK